jgi:hypothetical protein
MKTIYIYNTGNKNSYNSEYLCLTTYQSALYFISTLTVEDNVDNISFEHTLNTKEIKIKDLLDTEGINLLKTKNIYNNSYTLSSVDNIRYYIKSLPIQDIIISYSALYDRILQYENKEKGTEVRIMVINEYCYNVRNNLHVTKEYYFPDLNIYLSNLKPISISINPKIKYDKKCVKILDLSFIEAEAFYKLLKYKALAEISEENVHELMNKLNITEFDDVNDEMQSNCIDYTKIPSFAEPYLNIINSGYISIDSFEKKNTKFLTHFLSHYSNDERYRQRVKNKYLIFNHDKMYIEISNKEIRGFINVKIEDTEFIDYTNKLTLSPSLASRVAFTR